MAKKAARRASNRPQPPEGSDLTHIVEALRPLAVECSTLQRDPKNARKHGEKDLKAIAASLAKYGQRRPLVVNRRTMAIEAGNGTFAAAGELGWEHVAVVFVDDDATTASGFALADNRTAELSEWDDQLLAEAIAALQIHDEDFAELLCLDDFDTADEPVTVTEDVPPQPPAEPITKPGDLWILGKHRLLCGDSTNSEHVARLMDGQRAGLMNTDPPYGVAYANDDRPNPGVAKPRVANDELCDEQLQAFLEQAFRAAVTHALEPNAAWYLWHAHLTQGYFAAAAAAAAANVVLHRQIIWVKPVLLLGRGQYHWKHEPAFMGWIKGKQPPDYGLGKGERTQTTVWEIGAISQAERKELNHSTPKPVGLFTIPIVKHLKGEEICYEPFSGSGPQFIAAEQLGRRCFGLELNPAFCDVIVQRWEKFTGEKAVLQSV